MKFPHWWNISSPRSRSIYSKKIMYGRNIYTWIRWSFKKYPRVLYIYIYPSGFFFWRECSEVSIWEISKQSSSDSCLRTIGISKRVCRAGVCQFHRCVLYIFCWTIICDHDDDRTEEIENNWEYDHSCSGCYLLTSWSPSARLSNWRSSSSAWLSPWASAVAEKCGNTKISQTRLVIYIIN